MVFCNLLFVLQIRGLIKSHNPYFNRWFSAIIIRSFHKIIIRIVTILILIDGFLQYYISNMENKFLNIVTILILIDGFLQCIASVLRLAASWVTILILIDGFLQCIAVYDTDSLGDSHNPYFNRWFSAIKEFTKFIVWMGRHNPYFNRWFSAIDELSINKERFLSHNPYFNRWFSAIA